MNKSIFSSLTFLAVLVGVTVWSIMPVFAAQQRSAIIVYHNDWGGAVPALQSELQSRGYTVTKTDSATVGLQSLTNASNYLKAGDYLVVYLAGHGWNPRSFGDFSKNTALEHFVQFNNGILKVKQTAPLFEKIAQKGVNLTVIDGSCNGGETVLYAIGQKYCALSTVGVLAPSLTNFPYPSNAIHKDSNPGKFGTWWATSHFAASWMNGEIVKGVPERIGQRLFRNDTTEIANLSLFLRPAIGCLPALDLGGWNLHYQYCYLYRLIYPDDYAALSPTEKSKFTNNLQTYLATMHSIVDPSEPLYTKLNGCLNNPVLVNNAAKVYAAQYSQAWQCLANDPGWNIETTPDKHASEMKDLKPINYKGEAGFQKIAGEIEYLLSILQTGFQQQEELLKEIDAAARDLYPVYHFPDMTKKVLKPVWPPEPGPSTLQFNQHERALISKVLEIERRLKVDRPAMLGVSNLVRVGQQINSNDSRKTLNRGIETYQDSYKTLVTDKSGFPSLNLDPMKRQKLEMLIGKFKAISPTLYYAEGRLSFLLAIFEDAVGKAQGGASSPSVQVLF